jgi:phage host-nuclease inhibitor protein Gam
MPEFTALSPPNSIHPKETPMATTRIKPAATIIRSLEQADGALHEIGSLDYQLQQEQADLAQQIEDMKKALLERQAPLVEARERLLEALQAYATHEKEELFPDGEKRSIDLPFGTLGWRRSTEISLTRKCTVEHLEGLGLFPCVSVKKSVSKSELAKLEAETLAQAGARRTEKDTFFVDLNRERLEESFQNARNRKTA